MLDDGKARAAAQALGIPLIGDIARVRVSGHFSAAKPLIEKLRQVRFHADNGLLSAVLNRQGRNMTVISYRSSPREIQDMTLELFDAEAEYLPEYKLSFFHKKIGHLCLLLTLAGVFGIRDMTLGPIYSQPIATNGTHSPARLRLKMAHIARVTHGPVGAAALVVEGGTVAALHGEHRFPMQSVYKLPIGMAVLHEVDLGRLNLNQPVWIGPNDLMPSSRGSLIRDKYPHGTKMTVSELLDAMMSVSDGTASDVLLKLAGGPERVTTYLRGLGVGGVVVATSEREMAKNEQVQYRNWATPDAMLGLLRALQQGRGLSVPSSRLLLGLMAGSKTGPDRIKGLLPAGTVVAHKTGSSGTVDGLTRATNDVGLITLPDGRHLAVVVFVSDTRANEAIRDMVIAKIARAAWDCWRDGKAKRKNTVGLGSQTLR